MLTLDTAHDHAKRYLEEQVGEGDHDLVFTRAELHESGWLFYYCTAAWLTSRSFVDVLGGAHPILVNADGEARVVNVDETTREAGPAIHPGIRA